MVALMEIYISSFCSNGAGTRASRISTQNFCNQEKNVLL